MKRIIVGNCIREKLLHLSDPDAPSEAEVEHQVARALTCIYPSYHCMVFSGGFMLDGDVFRPDLALVAADFSHWFIIEVELVSHSFERHVLPQVKAFRYGTALPECSLQFANALDISHAQVQTLVRHVPRAVIVIANKREPYWEIALRSHAIQLLVVSAYTSPAGIDALELDGEIEVVQESLGFGIYSATDRSLRFPKSVRLTSGEVQIHDSDGGPAIWSIRRDDANAWITKEVGSPSIKNGAHVQLIRSVNGKIVLKRP